MSNPNHPDEMCLLALQRVETESGWYAGVGVDAGDAEAVARAQVRATLALAYEQRTANLIAVWQTGEVKSDGAVYGIMPDLRMKVWGEIADRLGLS